MSQPEVKIGCVSNLYSRMMHFKEIGDCEQGHTHPFDHLTLLASGSVEVELEGNKTTYVAPQMIFIKAEKVHKLTALAPDTVAYCIHALRVGERVEDILDPDMIPKGLSGLDVTASRPLSFDK